MCSELAEINAGYFHGALIAAAAPAPRVVTKRVTKGGGRWQVDWDES